MKTEVLLILALVVGSRASVDRTRVEREVGTAVTEAVVDMIGASCVFEDDALFLRRIAHVETQDGRGANTFLRNGTAYYGGIWQVDEAAFERTKEAGSLLEDIKREFDVDWASLRWEQLVIPLYSGLAARLVIHQLTSEEGVPRSVVDQANLWAEEYQTHGAKPSDFETAANGLNSDCEIPKADLVFVLDASTSIEPQNFILMKEFVASVVESFSIGENSVRVGLITYSHDAEVEFHLGKHTEKADVIEAIRNTHYLTGSTNSAAALRSMSRMFTKYGRGSQGVPEIAIFMTDGKSQDAAGTARAADEVHAQMLTVFAIGITDGVNKDEVERIGTDPDCVHVYYLQDFSDITHFASQIEREACKAPAELASGEEVTDEVMLGAAYHFKTEVAKTEGATVLAEMVEGAVDVYLSYDIRNPSEVVHDQHFIASSADGPSGMYLPFPEETVCEGSKESGSKDCKTKSKRSSRSSGSGSGEDEEDMVELYGTVVGRNPGMRNWYKLKVVEGWGMNGAEGARGVWGLLGLMAALIALLIQ